jgi:dolichyl-phosphate-mannose-protein mannosyltransferase
MERASNVGLADADPPVGEAIPTPGVSSTRRAPRWLRAAVLVPVAVVAVAAGLRFWNLSQPSRTYGDEGWYALDAYGYLGGATHAESPDDPTYRIDGEATWVHPPLGKWLIALGIGPLGFHPFDWRVMPALFGVAAVLLLYLLALELWGSVRWAGLASGLLALDGLHIVQSRIAMLDAFLSTFVLAGIYLVVLDLRRMRRDPQGRIERWFGSRYLLGAGLCLGGAAATKWSGLYGLALAALLAVRWSVRAPGTPRNPVEPGRRVPGESGRRGLGDRAPRRGPWTLPAAFVLVPLGVYLLAYWQLFAEHGPDLLGFLGLQARMFGHGLHHAVRDAGSSSAWGWPLLLRPIRYFPSELARGAARREVLAVGNPVLWWGFLALLPVSLDAALRRRDPGARLALAGYGAMYLPWLAFSRTQFLYYMTPAIPFMCLAVVAALRSFPPRARTRAASAFGGASLLAAAAFAPVWLFLQVPEGWLHALHWLPSWPR